MRTLVFGLFLLLAVASGFLFVPRRLRALALPRIGLGRCRALGHDVARW